MTQACRDLIDGGVGAVDRGRGASATGLHGQLALQVPIGQEAGSNFIGAGVQTDEYTFLAGRAVMPELEY